MRESYLGRVALAVLIGFGWISMAEWLWPNRPIVIRVIVATVAILSFFYTVRFARVFWTDGE
jgi:hypothetical protein